MKKNLTYILLTATALNIAGCGQKKTAAETAQASPAIPVVVKQTHSSATVNEISISGNIEGNQTVKLGFLVAGKINYIAIPEGSSIGAGQLLSSLEPENYRIAKDMSDASLTQVQDEYNRLQTMHERGSVSEGDFTKISNGLKQAAAQNRLQAKNLSDTRLVSPISGVLLKKGTEVGEIVGSGMPLFVVSDIRTVKVSAALPESELQYVKIGQQARVYVSALDSTFTGKVTEVGSAAEATTRAFTVKIELANPQLLIRPGMTAEVKLAAGVHQQLLALPGEAILHDIDNSAYVFVADKAKNQAFKRKVTLGTMVGNDIVITSGLREDDWVVVGGQHNLHDGFAITIQ